MKHIFAFFIFCLACLSASPIVAQEKILLKSADEAFRNQKYDAAIPLYEKLIAKRSDDTASLKKLSICYSKIKDTENAERVLNVLIVLRPDDVQVVQLYANALAGNGKYDRAKLAFERCRSMNPYDKIAENYLRDYQNVSLLFKDSSRYSISSLSINTEYSEFSPALYKQSLVYVSSRPQEQSLRTNKKAPMFDLYVVDTAAMKKTGLSNHLDCVRENTSAKIRTQHSSTDAASANYPANPFLKRISANYHEGPVSFSKQYDTVYLTRNYIPDGENKLQESGTRIGIYYSIVGKSGTYETVYPLDFTTDVHSVAHPSLSKDGQSLYFSSDMMGGAGGMDIYVARKKDGTWSKPENLKALNTPGNEVFPYVDENNILYYSSDGSGGLGGLDIYSYNLSLFAEPVNMGFPINSCKDDFGLLMYNNGRNGYFSSNRHYSASNDNLYAFAFNDPGYKTIQLRALLLQAGNQITPLAACEIDVLKKDGRKKIGTLKLSDSDEITLPANVNYLFIGNREPYQADIAEHFVQPGVSTEMERVNIVFREKDSFIEYKPKAKLEYKTVNLTARLFDKNTGRPVSALVALYLGNEKNQFDLLNAGESGVLSKTLIPGTHYFIKVADSRYEPMTDSVFAPSGAGEIQKTYYLVPNSSVKEISDSLQTDWKKEARIIKNKIDALSKASYDEDKNLILLGCVLNENTNESVKARLILVANNQAVPEQEALTDMNGRFVLKVNREKSYTVQVIADGYFIKRFPLTFQNSYIVYFLPPLPTAKAPSNTVDSSLFRKIISEQRPVSFKGVIREKESNAPITTLVALFLDNEDNLVDMLYSDEAGNIETTLIPNRKYLLRIADERYLMMADSLFPTSYVPEMKRRYMMTPNISVSQNDQTRESWNAKSAKVVLKGVIVDAINKKPLNAIVRVVNKRDTSNHLLAISDFDGTFSFSLTTSGLYSVSILSEGYQPVAQQLDIQEGKDEPQAFYLNQATNNSQAGHLDSVIAHYRNRIMKKVTLTGEVLDEAGRVPVISFVCLYQEGVKDPVAIHPSDENGMVAFYLNRNEIYRVEIREPGYLPINELVNTSDTAVIYRKTFRLKTPVKKEVYDSLQAGWKEMSVDKKTIVYGSILEDTTFRPIPSNIKVYAEETEGSVLVSKTDENGHFTLAVSPGKEYLVEASSHGYQTVSNHLLIPVGSKMMNVYYHLKPLIKSTDKLVANSALRDTPEAIEVPVATSNSTTAQVIRTSTIRPETSFRTPVFGVNQTKFGITDGAELLKLGKYLERNPASNLVINGYSDSVGLDAYNQVLSHRRALSVQLYLVQHRVPATRITVTGKGENNPVASNETETGRHINRRVQFELRGISDTSISVVNNTGIQLLYSPKENRWIGKATEEIGKELKYMAERNASMVVIFNIVSKNPVQLIDTENAIKNLCAQYGIPSSKILIQKSGNRIAQTVLVEVLYRE